jgi:hypothetical protein
LQARRPSGNISRRSEVPNPAVMGYIDAVMMSSSGDLAGRNAESLVKDNSGRLHVS